MDFNDAVEHVLDGHALLFTGAGFSSGATNLRGTTLKVGGTLAQHLSSLSDLPSTTKLEDAAEEFVELFGEDTLINELEQEFTVKTVTSAHVDLLTLPWKRVYTTNYDNVLESAAALGGKRLTPVVLSDELKALAKTGTLCVHLNGYVQRLSRNALHSELKLTDTSYLSSSIADSPWAVLFRNDIDIAKAVLFVGYSIVDLDIRRVLFATDSLLNKCFFIIGATPDQITARRVSRYGTVVPYDTTGLAVAIKEKALSYSPRRHSTPLGYCVKRFEAPATVEPFTDRYMFDLLLRGEIRPSTLWGSLHGGNKYVIERPGVGNVLDALDKVVDVAVIHSDLGNGKTVALTTLQCRGIDRGYDVYSVSRRGDSLFQELELLCQTKAQVLIVIENYPDWFDALAYLNQHMPAKCSLVLSARTSVNDVTIDRLIDTMDAHKVGELSVDQLTHGEADELVQLFNEYGLWGAEAAYTRGRKARFIQRVCNAQWHAILIKRFEAPQMRERFVGLLNNLGDTAAHYDIVVAILILTVLGYPPSVNVLVDLIGQPVLEASLRRHPSMQEFIEFSSGQIKVRSSVAAEFMLTQLADPNVAISVMIRIATTADKLAGVNHFYFQLLKSLTRFSSLQEVFPESVRRKAAMKYFESIKRLEHTRAEPLFWLQYAIACVVFEEFDRAGEYFATSYALAETRSRYDTYQIDNHYARFIMMRAIRNPAQADVMIVFREARVLLFRQMYKERLHYSYRVAKTFGELYDTFFHVLTEADRKEIAQAAQYICDRIEGLPGVRQGNRNIKECRHEMQRIIARG